MKVIMDLVSTDASSDFSTGNGRIAYRGVVSSCEGIDIFVIDQLIDGRCQYYSMLRAAGGPPEYVQFMTDRFGYWCVRPFG